METPKIGVASILWLNQMVVDVSKFSIITEKILKSISSAVYLSQHLLFSELTQPFERTQKVNKDLTPSDSFQISKQF